MLCKNDHIALIVDIPEWAFANIANNVKTHLIENSKVTILYWEDYNNPLKIVKEINKLGANIVHFFFREHLNVIINISNKNDLHIKEFCKKTITTHIPDYLYSSDSELAERYRLFKFCDSYFTINTDLFKLYQKKAITPPHTVIYDAPKLDKSNFSEHQDINDNEITILWSGNSKWGEYAGLTDYKGYKSVIKPAIEKLQHTYPTIKFITMDSAEKYTPHDEVLATLEKTDILLIASKKEGTPLTLIEAMYHGCAVVSTDVGISREVLPSIQTDFICERTPEAFYQSINKLIANPSLLNECKKQNKIAYNTHFGEQSSIHTQWCVFFSEAKSKNTLSKYSEKLALLPDRKNASLHNLTVRGVKTAANFAKQTGMIPALKRMSPKFASIYHRVLHGNGLGSVNYQHGNELYSNALQKAETSHPLVIYAPMWKGVAASTEAIFGNNAVKYPLFDTEFPEVNNHKYMHEFAKILASSQHCALIYSGGSEVHLELARKVKNLAQDKKQYFMWHGSPAQWTDASQLAHFQKWRSEYESGTITAFITVKRDLDKTLQKLGIRSYYINNPIPDLAITPSNSVDDGTINVGLFSAINSWYKNPNVQLLAIAGKSVTLNTNLDQKFVESINPNIVKINYFNHMSRDDFISVLSNQAINLYITNTECSPMIALESWALNIPCIVGPAGDIYSQVDEELASYLVEPKVDDPHSISRKIDLVIDNLEKIKILLEKNKTIYNGKHNSILSVLYKNLQ